MKKIVLGIIIIGLVIGVSYVKNQRQSQREESLFAEGARSRAGQADSLKQTAESLAVLIEQQQSAFSDSMQMTKAEFDSHVDSLENLVAARDSVLEAANRVSTKRTAAEPTTRDRKEESRQEKNDAIIAYYKKRYQGLPKDLSNYEHRVALSEIREETAAKFSITTDQLAKLRRQYNLSY